MEEKIKIVRKFNQENRYRDCGVINNAIDDVLNELERLQKENEEYKKFYHRRLKAYNTKSNEIIRRLNKILGE